jgi:hypothetical protein
LIDDLQNFKTALKNFSGFAVPLAGAFYAPISVFI